jgi:hypothetical protein
MQVVAALVIGSVGVIGPTPRIVTQPAMATETRAPAREAAEEAGGTTIRAQDPTTTTSSEAAGSTTMPTPGGPATTTSRPSGGSTTTSAPDATGEAVGPTDRLVVAEDTRDFNLIGLTLPEAPAEPVLVRTAAADGAWSPWQPLTFDAEEPLPPVPGAPVPEEPEQGNPGEHSEPLWVGDATRYELSLTGEDLSNARVHLVYETTRQVAVLETGSVEAAVNRPAIQSRAAWGARPPRSTPSIASALHLAVVHHSAGTNAYTAADVPALLRSIQAYHMDANGWDDIGYNFAVDRFGRIWEARAGGIDRAVIGAHAAGFNTGSTGVSVLGNFDTAAVTPAAVSAVNAVLTWKFVVHGVDPRTSVAYRVGSGSPRFPPGSVITTNRIVAHRDVGNTACPGGSLYAQLGNIRSAVAAGYAGATALPSSEAGTWALASSATGRLDMFAVSGTGTLAYRSRSPAGTWSGVTDLGGALRSQPAAVSWAPGRLDVFVRGTDNLLWHRVQQAGRWTAWRSLGGTLSSAPAAASWSPGRLDVFVRGTDNVLWHRWHDGGAWSAWRSLGGTLTSSPAATSHTTGTIDVVARGGPDTTYHRAYTAGRWSPWHALGGTLTSQPALASPRDGLLDLVVRGTNGGFWLRRWDRAAGWGGWTSLGGQLTTGPGATADATNTTLTLTGRSPNGAGYLTTRPAPTTPWTPWTRIP